MNWLIDGSIGFIIGIALTCSVPIVAFKFGLNYLKTHPEKVIEIAKKVNK